VKHGQSSEAERGGQDDDHVDADKAHHSPEPPWQSQPEAKAPKTTPEAQPQRGREMAAILLRNV
jgi:hypothetical protein